MTTLTTHRPRGLAAQLLFREVRLGPPGGFRPALRLFPLLLAAERGQVQVVIRAAGLLAAPAVGGVGVEDGVAVPQETAQPRLLGWLRAAEVVVGAGLAVLL